MARVTEGEREGNGGREGDGGREGGGEVEGATTQTYLEGGSRAHGLLRCILLL